MSTTTEQSKLAEAFLKTVWNSMNKQGITQSELARRLGISPPALFKVLSGQENVTLPRAERIASELGIPSRKMFGKVDI